MTWAPIVAVGAVPVVVERGRVLVDHGRRWFTIEAGDWIVWHRAR